LKFQAVAEKTAKDARGLLYFAAPGIQAVRETATIRPRKLTFWPWKWYPSHVWRGLPQCQF